MFLVKKNDKRVLMKYRFFLIPGMHLAGEWEKEGGAKKACIVDAL